MSRMTYLVTGAEGFLGSTIVRQLRERGDEAIACVLDRKRAESLAGLDVPIITCDVTKAADLDAAMSGIDPTHTTVIHTAGIISIASKRNALTQDVNVGGTTQVINACRRNGIRRLVYTSSVHAMPEPEPGMVGAEVDRFDADLVEGDYAKSKAEATRRVLFAQDLDRVVVQPSGIWGPDDLAHGHVTQAVADLVQEKLPVMVRGGYDLVDVRDVASGTIAAADRGRRGMCYLLTGFPVTMEWVSSEVRKRTGARVPRLIPLWAAMLCACPLERMAAWRKVKPTVTRYSLHTLRSQAVFSHERASHELGYFPRPAVETLEDTLNWLTARRGLSTRSA